MQLGRRMILLKDGRTAVLRSPKPMEAAQLLRCYQLISGETPFLTRTQEEALAMTPEGERAFVEQSIADPNMLLLVAVVDGEIVGDCHIAFNTLHRSRHYGSIGISILRSHWGLGLGTAMLACLEDAARSHPHVHLIRLAYMEGNDRARALYDKMGYREIGRLPDSFRTEDGVSRTEIFMQKDL